MVFIESSLTQEIAEKSQCFSEETRAEFEKCGIPTFNVRKFSLISSAKEKKFYRFLKKSFRDPSNVSQNKKNLQEKRKNFLNKEIFLVIRSF